MALIRKAGYDKYACPRRYYCIRQAKLTFTKLIVDDGLEWPSLSTVRSQREIIEGQFRPNRAQKFLLEKSKETP